MKCEDCHEWNGEKKYCEQNITEQDSIICLLRNLNLMVANSIREFIEEGGPNENHSL